MPFNYAGHRPVLTQTYGVVDPVAALTEYAGVVGGTNDGDLPDISTVSGTYAQAEIVAIRDACREIAAKVNVLIAALSTR